MIIGIPKEIKPQEYRVALTPEAVARLARAGHKILVQKGAGEGCGFSDQSFRDSAANIVSDAKHLWREAELILKVKEPLAKEHPFFKPGLILFTFLHLANAPTLARALLKKGVSAVGYETVAAEDGSLPLLAPMSKIAGKLAVLVGADYLRTDQGEKGVLLSSIEGARRGQVTLLGAGNVGCAALEVAVGLGAAVTLLDRRSEKLQRLKEIYGDKIQTVVYDQFSLARLLMETDLFIGAVLIPGAKAPKLVTKKMVADMQKGSVLVDVSIDQGACIESMRPTTHARPVYLYKGIIHYGVSNMPSLVARSATEALVSKTVPYIEKLAGGGIEALRKDPLFQQGLQIHQGKVLHPAVREALHLG